jgi:peptidyl-prolyl cis-trans isomerase C
MMKRVFLPALLAFSLFAQNAPIPDDAVVGKVAGRDLTMGEVRTMLRGAPPNLSQAIQTDPRGVINSLLILHSLAAEGFKQELEQQSPLKEQLEYQRKQLVAQAYLDRNTSRFYPTNDEVLQFYRDKKDRFETATVRAIYVSFVAPDAPVSPREKTRTEAQAKKFIEDLAAQIAKGADFATLARKFSDDKESGAKGGEFGVIRKSDALDEEIKKAVFALTKGQISAPVKQANGFYLFQLDKRETQSYAEVREKLFDELRQSRFQEWFRGIQQQNSVEVLPGFFGRTPAK